MRAFTLRVPAAPAAPCRVHVGRGLLARFASWVARVEGGPCVLVSDRRVARLYGEDLLRLLRRVRRAAHLLTFPSGERHKTRESKARLEDALARLGAGRETLIVALGGGVAGDLAGFLAATWNRGVRFVQVPTTLVAMVDAALGGKTGVDLPAGKNLVGAFHQPLALWADVDTLRTLEGRAFRAGLAEAVKTAVVADRRLFEWIERARAALLAREGRALETLVHRCLRLKAALVARDPYDRGPRGALNFGHTVGHAIEQASGFRVPHGEAVAVGMVVEADLARAAQGFPVRDGERLRALLQGFGLPVRCPEGVPAEAVIAATRADKKRRRGATRYALPRAIGKMPRGVLTTVSPQRLRAALERAR